MSLSDKWDKYRESWADSRNRTEPSPYWTARLREAFYAGAEAALEAMLIEPRVTLEAELDRFKGLK